MRHPFSNGQNQVDYALLEKYLEGVLNSDQKQEVENLLAKSRSWFEAMLDLKEARFLMSSGMKATEKEISSVLDRVEDEKAGFVRIFVRMVKGTIMVSSGDQENQDFNAIEANFSFIAEGRVGSSGHKDKHSHSDNRPGTVSIERIIKKNKIKLLLKPSDDSSHYSLKVKLESKSKFDIHLLLNSVLIEEKEKVKNSTAFSEKIPATSNCDLVFFHKKREDFRIALKLQSE